VDVKLYVAKHVDPIRKSRSGFHRLSSLFLASITSQKTSRVSEEDLASIHHQLASGSL
jgi:hypothetical protein